MADESDSSGLVWFFAGAAIGAAIAILYAPQSGEETRRKLVEKTGEGRQSLQESSREMLERGKEMYERGRKLADDAADLFEKGRKLVENTAANVQEKAQGSV